MKELPPELLLIAPEGPARAAIASALANTPPPGYRLHLISDRAELNPGLARHPRFALVISVLALDSLTGEALIAEVNRALPETPIVVLTPPDQTGLAASLLQSLQVADYVLDTPEHLALLPTVVKATLDHAAARRAAQEAEQRFTRMAENAPDMIFRWSYARGFEYVSPASVEVVGYTPDEHYADPGLVYRVIHPDDIPIYDSVFSELVDPEGPRRHCVIRWLHKDGHTVHVEMRMSPLYDARGELVAIEGIARDISQHVITRERLRELTVRLTQAQEEERRRLARELHDEVGQALTIIKMRMRMAQNALPPEIGPAREKLDAMGTLIDEALKTVRALSHELRPPLLDELGWNAALEWLCDSFAQRTSLQVGYQQTGHTDRLDGQTELTAYRVVQEALTNAARHAGASRVLVTASADSSGLRVTIQDDGCGFDLDRVAQSGQPRSALGLLGMQERVDTVGGSLSIDSAPGTGTTIHVFLPCQKPEEEP